MSTETLEITRTGLLTTVQDRGRYGYQKFGVPVSGAMDEFALRAANILLGNDDGAAGLEITVLGPKCTPASSNCFIVTLGNFIVSRLFHHNFFHLRTGGFTTNNCVRI